jgi:hypothetical protein
MHDYCRAHAKDRSKYCPATLDVQSKKAAAPRDAQGDAEVKGSVDEADG